MHDPVFFLCRKRFSIKNIQDCKKIYKPICLLNKTLDGFAAQRITVQSCLQLVHCMLANTAGI